jgi:2-oxoglutarate ferredoxin oxidoreductase subunit gamma
MERSTILAGFGGQGLLFAGHVLAEAALRDGLDVSWMPSYGPEMRGGTASCTVIVADRPIGSPVVDIADGVIALNPPSLMKYEPIIAPGGLLLVNTSLIEMEPTRRDVEICPIACSALARRAGDDRLIGIVALGALLARRPVVKRGTLEAALSALVARAHPELHAANLAAFRAGYEAGRLDGAPGGSGRRCAGPSVTRAARRG